MEQGINWKISDTEFAMIVDAESGKQVADFGSPQFPPEEIERNLKIGLAAPSMLTKLKRAEFLMRRASQGDHEAFERLAEAADECCEVIEDAGDTPLME